MMVSVRKKGFATAPDLFYFMIWACWLSPSVLLVFSEAHFLEADLPSILRATS